MIPNKRYHLVDSVHKLLWPILAIYFLLLTIAELLIEQSMPWLTATGIILICLATFARTIAMAIDFRETDNPRFAWLSILLAVLIIAATLIGQTI